MATVLHRHQLGQPVQACGVVAVVEVGQRQVTEAQRVLDAAVVGQQEHVHLVQDPAVLVALVAC